MAGAKGASWTRGTRGTKRRASEHEHTTQHSVMSSGKTYRYMEISPSLPLSLSPPLLSRPPRASRVNQGRQAKQASRELQWVICHCSTIHQLTKRKVILQKKKNSTSANSYAITKTTLNDASCICHDIHLSFGCTSECWKLLVGKWVWRNISELFALKGEVKSKMAFKNVRPH